LARIVPSSGCALAAALAEELILAEGVILCDAEGAAAAVGVGTKMERLESLLSPESAVSVIGSLLSAMSAIAVPSLMGEAKGVGVEVERLLCAYAKFVMKAAAAKAQTNKRNFNRRTIINFPGRF
jgi:hypothetical protein